MSSYADTGRDFGSNRTLTAFFDNRIDADAASERLVGAGISRDRVRLIPGNQSDGTASNPEEDKGFWASLADLFMPDEDRHTYAEGLRRGGYIVTVSGLTTTEYETALDILDDEGSVDLNEREASWREEGWAGFSGSATSATGYGDVGGISSREATSTRVSDDEVIPVVEESLRVGKRDIEGGRVRVRSYVVESPVSEDVSLHDETVHVERRSVDRPLASGEALFQDRTIEAEEHHEEAVIAKEARVTEEISLRRESSDRVETVSDTVRRTEVEVEDQRTGRSPSTPDRRY